ncbi:transmembrane protein 252-like [Brachionichthys hirsutus]|uniref:transmembrane protein 252-like n=1 Tax=Brachionichthys hirsutus TaxID=412623 RepID=UPI003604E39E
MNMKKQLSSLAHLVLIGVGFALTCTGSYLVSFPTERFTWKVVPAYFMIAVGVMTVLIGIFWAIFNSMKSKLYHRGGHEEQIQVFTIERPSSFPPTYEESQSSQVNADAAPGFVVMADGVDMMISLAPPLYSQDSSEAPDCTWSWERPPRYSTVERLQ